MGTSRFRTGGEQTIPVEQNTTTSSSDGVDVQLGCLDGDTRRSGLKDVLKGPAEPRNVRGCPSHIETDNR